MFDFNSTKPLLKSQEFHWMSTAENLQDAWYRGIVIFRDTAHLILTPTTSFMGYLMSKVYQGKPRIIRQFENYPYSFRDHVARIQSRPRAAEPGRLAPQWNDLATSPPGGVEV